MRCVAWVMIFFLFLHLNKRICCGGEGRITSTTKTNEMWCDGLNDFRLLCPQLRARGLKKRKRLNPIHVAWVRFDSGFLFLQIWSTTLIGIVREVIATTLILFIPRVLDGRRGGPHAGRGERLRVAAATSSSSSGTSVAISTAAAGATVPPMVPIPVVIVGPSRVWVRRRWPRRAKVRLRFVVGHHRVVVPTVRRVPAAVAIRTVPVVSVPVAIHAGAVPVRRRGHEPTQRCRTHLAGTRWRHKGWHERCPERRWQKRWRRKTHQRRRRRVRRFDPDRGRSGHAQICRRGNRSRD